MAVEIKSAADIAKMRATCKLAASVLDFIKPHVVPGAKTDDLDKLCHDYIMDHGAYPSPLNYKGFPKSTCISINEVVCHGIPDERRLKEGDIVNIDITTTLDGYFGDTSEMFAVGEISEEAQRLIDVTRDAMWIGIKEVAPKKRIGDIGASIYEFAGDKEGYGVVTDFCGHGIGRQFHMDPQVPHVARRGTRMRMRPGMTFTIEPMINTGTANCRVLDDNWTAVTTDGGLSAQTEHTILVTPTGYEVLTMRETGYRPDGVPLKC